MEHSSDWKEPLTRSERKKRRRERSLLAILLTFVLAVISILIALIHSYLQAQQPLEASGSSSIASAVSAPTPDLPAVKDGLLVTFLDVGQGDSAVLRSPTGKIMLIDGGPDGSFGIIDQQLMELGVSGIDVLIASHLHADHIGGLIPVIDTYPVGDVYYPPFDAESETYFNFLDALKESQATVHNPLAGVDTMIPWDDNIEVRILAPYDTIYDDFNDTSYIIRVSYGNNAVLFTGDTTELGEKLALKAQRNRYFKADVLKVAHHGSRDGTFEAFLDAVSPAIAVISCGRNNDYGHPNQELLDRLTERGITIYRTDLDGSITLLLDGTSVRVVK